MNIAILSRNAEIHSTARLAEAARARGHHVDILNPLAVTLEFGDVPRVHYRGLQLPAYDVVVPRIGASISLYGLAVLRQFEPLNASAAIARAQDKLLSTQCLAQHHIPMPATAFAHDAGESDHLLRLVGGAPAIVKLVEGTQGVGVVLGETEKSLRSMIEAFRGARVDILVQQFIEEAGAKDLRAFVIRGEVIAAMERSGAAGDFRSNLHRGGSAQAITLTADEQALALQAASVIGLDVAGVDMLRSKRGALVIEVNASPGLEGIEAVSGVDVAGAMIAAAETLA
jgi:ribosomal protein S6--L-glutamate ligase